MTLSARTPGPHTATSNGRGHGPVVGPVQGRAHRYGAALIGAIQEPVLLLDADLGVRAANEALHHLLRTGAAGAHGRPLHELFAGLSAGAGLLARLRALAAGGEPLDALDIEADVPGIGLRSLSLSARRIEGPDDEPLVVVTITDRTAQHAAQRTAHESEHRSRHLLQSLPVAVYTCDVEGRITFYNRAAAALWGREPAINHDLWCGSWRIFNPADGSPVALDSCPMARTLRDGRPVRGEEIIVERPDGTRRFVLPFPDPIRDSAGVLVGATNTLIDLTDRKLAEDEISTHRDRLDALVRERTVDLEESHRRLRLSERLASIGTLSAGLGHDIANLLVPIRVRLESLKDAPLPAPLQEDVRALHTSTEYLQRLSNGLRLLAIDPGGSRAGERTELRAWWCDAGPMLRNALPRGVTLDGVLPDDPCWAAISRPALTQAVFNLVQNAGDAMKPRGHGCITVSCEHSSERIVLRVADDGPGMPPEVRAHCMEPYFTTKTRAMSTGFGLLLVYGLITDAGGSVDLDSEVGRGTTFTITLPAGAPPARVAPEKRRIAAVTLKDPRLAAFVTAELRALALEVVKTKAAPPNAALHITDDPGAATAPGARVILFAPQPPVPSPDTLTALGFNPKPNAIRQALRAAASTAELPSPA